MQVETLEFDEHITLSGYPIESVECVYCGADQWEPDAIIHHHGPETHYRCRYCGGQWDRREYS